jgi:hypothetical protein
VQRMYIYPLVQAVEALTVARLPYFEICGSQMAARLSALRTARFYPQEDSWYSFLLEAESTPGP